MRNTIGRRARLAAGNRRDQRCPAIALMLCLTTCVLIGASAARAADSKPINWDALTAEATTLLSRYIRINTTNPPGNELAAAQFLKEKFLADGIPAVVFQPAPGRGVVAARLRGIGRHRKAVILLSHMDVVPADPKDWSVPPFSGAVKDGVIWGRGALDDKGPGVIELMAMLAIKRSRILLDRDILFIATGDEEAGGKLGAGWVAEHEPKLWADAGYVLNEDGFIRVYKNGKKLYTVAVTEKSPLWLRLTAVGKPGHGAVPPEHSAVTRLVAALNKLIAYNSAAPVKVLPVVQEYFARLAGVEPADSAFGNLRKTLAEPASARHFLSEPYRAALVRDTIAPTVIDAGYKTNVVPSEATAQLDCRLLPGSDPKAFIKKVREIIDDRDVKIDEILHFPTLHSPERSPLMDAIELLAKRMDKGAVVTPMMTAGFNDCHYFRQHGLVAYGFIPIALTQGENYGVHGANEHLSVKELRGGIQRMVTLLEILGGK